MNNSLTGKSISYYHILNLLGEGGMGSVYLAEDTMLERKVAIKILNPLLTKDNLFVQRFRQEAKVQSTLHHPNIITLYTFFEEQGNYCMVMDYAEGETLKDLIKSIGPIPEKRVKNIFKQLIEGLQFAHKKGVIHRDIKPSNIMIDKDDNIKIMDFGIAKIMGDMNLTKTGMKMGTIYYMSPEQVRADKDIDYRTDIFSAEITLYEMLTGRLPYDTNTESDYEIMKDIVEREIKDPREFYPHISDGWISLIKVMTNKEKNERNLDSLKSRQDKNKLEIEVIQNEQITEPQSPKTIFKEVPKYNCPKCNIELKPGRFARCPNCNVNFRQIIIVKSKVSQDVEESKILERVTYNTYACFSCFTKLKKGIYSSCPNCSTSFNKIITVMGVISEGKSINNNEFYTSYEKSNNKSKIFAITISIVIVLAIVIGLTTSRSYTSENDTSNPIESHQNYRLRNLISEADNLQLGGFIFGSNGALEKIKQILSNDMYNIDAINLIKKNRNDYLSSAVNDLSKNNKKLAKERINNWYEKVSWDKGIQDWFLETGRYFSSSKNFRSAITTYALALDLNLNSLEFKKNLMKILITI